MRRTSQPSRVGLAYSPLRACFARRISRRRLLLNALGAGAALALSSLEHVMLSARVPAPTTVAFDAGTRTSVIRFPVYNAFNRTWARTDQPVSEGRVNRSWMWGPLPISAVRQEPYQEAPERLRDVQYHDKARMEVNHPDAPNDGLWYVTNGLLVVELVTARMQTGDDTFEPRAAAEINVAGDPDVPQCPTYADFAPLLQRPARPADAVISERLSRGGQVAHDAACARFGVRAFQMSNGHRIAEPFWAFMNSSGSLVVDGEDVEGRLFANPFYATGLPISEAYWLETRVAGAPRLILAQCFERRVLTYTPDNPAGWQVEAGNVGRHYYQWRYGRAPGLPDPPTLRERAAALGLELGVEIGGPCYRDAYYRALVTQQFNATTIDCGMYWPEVEPQPGLFDTRLFGQHLQFAKAAGQRVRGHPLVFPSTLPAWLRNGGYRRGELLDLLTTHVSTIVQQFRGLVDEWVVVNEPYIWPYRQDDIFYETIGPEYIEHAFRAAREADPTALLIFNDCENHTANGLCTQLSRDILVRLRAMKLVDALGVQMHLSASNPPDPTDVAATIRSYELPVYVTEFDINLHGVSGTQAERYQRQAEITSAMLTAVRASGVCSGFTVWGIGDKYSWLEDSLGIPDAAPTLFDDDLLPKPAYYALRDALAVAGTRQIV